MQRTVAVLFLLVAPATAQNLLAEVMQRAAAVPHVSAEYTMTSPSHDGPVNIAFDYVAPARMRLVQTSSGMLLGMWSYDGRTSSRIAGDEVAAGDLDRNAISAETSALRARLRAALELPDEAAKPAAASATWQLQWAFDPKDGKGNFHLGIASHMRPPMPFGWLQTLAEKQAALTAEGDALKAATEGRFEITVDAATGLLRSFRGRGGAGEMSIALVRADFTTPPPPDRFVAPPRAKDAVDISEDMAKGVRSAAIAGERRWLCERLAAADGPFAGADAQRAAGEERARRALREFTVASRGGSFDQLVARLAERHGQLLKRVAALREAGKSAEEAAFRKQVAEVMTKSLTPQGEELVARTSLPPDLAALPFAAEALAAERAVVADLFRERVVAAAIAAFEKACDDARK